MNTAELIYQEIKELPEFEAQEVLDFVAFLKQKLKTNQENKPKKESTIGWAEARSPSIASERYVSCHVIYR